MHVIKHTSTAVPFYVSEKWYKTQSLTIANKRKVDPEASDLNQIAQETQKMATLFKQYRLDSATLRRCPQQLVQKSCNGYMTVNIEQESIYA